MVVIKVGEPTRPVVYNICVPFLAGLYGCCTEVFSPFCLAFYEEVACELVYSTYGPPSIYLEHLRDSIDFNAGLAGNMSADGVADMVSGRGIGVQTDEYSEVLPGWGRSRGLPLAMRGNGLAVRVKSLRVVCRDCRSARRIGIGSDTNIGWRRGGLSIAERLLPETKETFGKMLGKIAFRSGCELLGSLVKVFTKGPEDLKFGVVGSNLLIDELVGCFRNVNG